MNDGVENTRSGDWVTNSADDDFAKEFALQNSLDEALVRKGVALYEMRI